MREAGCSKSQAMYAYEQVGRHAVDYIKSWEKQTIEIPIGYGYFIATLATKHCVEYSLPHAQIFQGLWNPEPAEHSNNISFRG
jgi:hypothetical protein